MTLRQLLRRPVRECDAEIRGEFDGDVYVITTTCPHLKHPRVIRHRFVGDEALQERARQGAWERAHEDLRTHTRYSDPW